jgi:hypothetical protein
MGERGEKRVLKQQFHHISHIPIYATLTLNVDVDNGSDGSD